MQIVLKLTKIPPNSIVIKQSGGKFFIAAPDSIIIDKAGLTRLIEELVMKEFLDTYDLQEILNKFEDKQIEDSVERMKHNAES